MGGHSLLLGWGSDPMLVGSHVQRHHALGLLASHRRASGSCLNMCSKFSLTKRYRAACFCCLADQVRTNWPNVEVWPRVSSRLPGPNDFRVGVVDGSWPQWGRAWAD
jgi:hypothetical protein